MTLKYSKPYYPYPEACRDQYSIACFWAHGCCNAAETDCSVRTNSSVLILLLYGMVWYGMVWYGIVKLHNIRSQQLSHIK